MANDLARLLAALNAATDPDRPRSDPGVTTPARKTGRPLALNPAQVESIRRRRRLPLARRPRITELAAEFRVDRWTIRRALYGAPPYDWGDPAPRKGSRHRTRGSQRFPP